MSDWRIAFEPVLTPLFRTWWRFRRGMTLGVRGIALDGQDRVLLVRHTYSKGWHLPGGGVEHGEGAVEALIREMAEEGGVEPIGKPRLIGFYSNHHNFKNDHIALYRYDACRPCQPKQDGEIAERGFFDRDSLPHGVTMGTLRRLTEVFDGAEPSARW